MTRAPLRRAAFGCALMAIAVAAPAIARAEAERFEVTVEHQFTVDHFPLSSFCADDLPEDQRRVVIEQARVIREHVRQETAAFQRERPDAHLAAVTFAFDGAGYSDATDFQRALNSDDLSVCSPEITARQMVTLHEHTRPDEYHERLGLLRAFTAEQLTVREFGRTVTWDLPTYGIPPQAPQSGEEIRRADVTLTATLVFELHRCTLDDPIDIEEVCDGKDNDCDGLTDEAIPDVVTGTDAGACQPRIERCVRGTMDVMDPGVGPTVEVCDGVDNDCDGSTDEGLACDPCELLTVTHAQPGVGTLVPMAGAVGALAWPQALAELDVGFRVCDFPLRIVPMAAVGPSPDGGAVGYGVGTRFRTHRPFDDDHLAWGGDLLWIAGWSGVGGTLAAGPTFAVRPGSTWFDSRLLFTLSPAHPSGAGSRTGLMLVLAVRFDPFRFD